MIAEIMHIFPSFTYEHLMNKISFKQFLLWHMHSNRLLVFKATNSLHDIEINETLNPENELDRINEDFIWNEELKRWE